MPSAAGGTSSSHNVFLYSPGSCILSQFFNVAGVFLRLFNLIMLVLLLAHWNACMQFLVPNLFESIPEDSWVKIEEIEVRATSLSLHNTLQVQCSIFTLSEINTIYSN